MNLWIVLENDVNLDDGRHCVAFWSWGNDEAKEYWRRTHPDPSLANESSCSAQIVSVSESPERDYPHEEGRYEVLRQMGWRCDGDSICSSCGLYEMDGTVPVCYECDQCGECGCECEVER